MSQIIKAEPGDAIISTGTGRVLLNVKGVLKLLKTGGGGVTPIPPVKGICIAPLEGESQIVEKAEAGNEGTRTVAFPLGRILYQNGVTVAAEAIEVPPGMYTISWCGHAEAHGLGGRHVKQIGPQITVKCPEMPQGGFINYPEITVTAPEGLGEEDMNWTQTTVTYLPEAGTIGFFIDMDISAPGAWTYKTVVEGITIAKIG